MAISYVSYTLSLNLGATLGGAGVRYRLYTRAGLTLPQIWSLFVVVVSSNWLGYALLAGGILAAQLVVLPPEWGMPAALTRVLGALMLAVPAATWLPVPPGTAATGPCATTTSICRRWVSGRCSACCPQPTGWRWRRSCIRCCIRMRGYFTVLGVLLASGLAGVVVRIPGGLGVIETVFLTMLGAQVPHGLLLAA